ncbi:hypothetical protein ACFPOI_31980 [Nonomuraea angiospora]|uniref:MarR family transcriptional regulator n=1 Tax=Nonomuraea angiospora TaxID=46172 RepID=A0ABR9LRZ7_9ACTN|nr:hypothetical protein [Nonomuraea angiospora]MBE1583445.1 hypothetical protein [Nonomuraea angiospora]
MKEDDDLQTGGEDLSAVVTAVLTGSRLLVAVAVRSLGTVGDRVTLPQFRMLVVLAGHGETKLVTMAHQRLSRRRGLRQSCPMQILHNANAAVLNHQRLLESTGLTTPESFPTPSI